MGPIRQLYPTGGPHRLAGCGWRVPRSLVFLRAKPFRNSAHGRLAIGAWALRMEACGLTACTVTQARAAPRGGERCYAQSTASLHDSCARLRRCTCAPDRFRRPAPGDSCARVLTLYALYFVLECFLRRALCSRDTSLLRPAIRRLRPEGRLRIVFGEPGTAWSLASAGEWERVLGALAPAACVDCSAV